MTTLTALGVCTLKMLQIQELFKDMAAAPPKKRGPNSERALVIQDMADLLGVPFLAVQRKTFHLPGGERTTKLMRSMLEEAMMEDRQEFRRIRLWTLIKRSNPARDARP